MPSDNEELSAEQTLYQREDVIDMNIFSQILEMDEPGDNEFSQSIVFGFFDQADNTIEQMDNAAAEKELGQLADLGHFLKGSSATLGLVKVRDSCEKIQRYGRGENLDGSVENDESRCLSWIQNEIESVKEDLREARELFDTFYEILSD